MPTYAPATKVTLTIPVATRRMDLSPPAPDSASSGDDPRSEPKVERRSKGVEPLSGDGVHWCSFTSGVLFGYRWRRSMPFRKMQARSNLRTSIFASKTPMALDDPASSVSRSHGWSTSFPSYAARSPTTHPGGNSRRLPEQESPRTHKKRRMKKKKTSTTEGMVIGWNMMEHIVRGVHKPLVPWSQKPT